MSRSCMAIAFLTFAMLISTKAFCSGIDREMRDSDKRFEKTVTLSAKTIYLGELLQCLQGAEWCHSAHGCA